MTPATAFVPLDGVTAIEASAGTGKTYTITQLYLRLLLEQPLDVASILVVTYTKAATAELRNRVRSRLVEAAGLFRAGASEDPFYAELLRRVPDRIAAERAIERALRGFDEAAIYTIHGFCQRVLSERAFESGVAFDAELVPDQDELVLEVIDDFWRLHVQAASPGFVRYLTETKKWTPERLRRELRGHLGRAYARIAVPVDPGDLDAAEARVATSLTALRADWPDVRSGLARVVKGFPLKPASYRDLHVATNVETISLLLVSGAPATALVKPVERFTSVKMVDCRTDPHWVPDHPIIRRCDELVAAVTARDAAYAAQTALLFARLREYGERELVTRKTSAGVQFYDDLLRSLASALQDSVRGASLAAEVRRRYPAALVDEFQDTDPVQYDVVRRIYGDAACPVVLVGDPKQAIYSFRGADVFSYMRARADAKACHALAVNWRADAPLVEAVNAVFGGRELPFFFEGIPFKRAEPAPGREAPALVLDAPGAALRLWWVAGDGDKSALKMETRSRIIDTTASEIARMLAAGQAGTARLGKDQLVGGHIAVLVRTNDEGRRMRRALLDRGVASVQQAVDSVFASREAEEVERVLVAIAEPGQAPLVRAALATEMLGWDADRLEALANDDVAWDERIERFHEYHQWWQSRGFASMWRELLVREGVAARLLAFPDGERRMTNLAHTAELLQAATMRRRGGIAALIEWLADARGATDGRPVEMNEDEHLLRLESDANLVQIVTVHKAKGLQYPIVFCPFLWDGNMWAERSERLVYHEEGNDSATLDVGPADEATRRRACDEELAERLRLLYVALTRAQHRCYLVWGKLKDGGKSPLAWLLHAQGGTDTKAIAARYDGLAVPALRAEVDVLVERSQGTIAIEPLPAASPRRFASTGIETATLQPRRLVHPVRGGWAIASFSALLADEAEPERLDFDQADEPVADTTELVLDPHGFPRGARAGRCLHSIFEAIDFTAPDPTVVATTLRTYGIDARWEPAVGAWLDRILATPLDDGSGLHLGAEPRGRRLDELGFYYPVDGVDVARLGVELARAGFADGAFVDAVTRLPARAARGFLTGAIDCVLEHGGRYFVLDYKSNRLGASLDAYAAAALVPAMARGHYWLQYLIYAVAVHRWLGRRLAGYDYDRHFGGIRYLFLRGMDPAHGPTHGVYADRPSRDVIERMDARLAGGAR
jgi:exodeoxyribonuclease V beta subunit